MEISRTDVEQMLSALRPATMCRDVTERMEYALGLHVAAAESHSYDAEVFTPITPATLGSGLQARLLAIVEHVPFRLNEKVVLFPVGSKQPQTVRGTNHAWMAVAACAAFGSLLAFVVPFKTQQGSGQVATLPAQEFTKNNRTTNIATASFGSKLEQAEDRGVIWSRDNQPMRMLRMEFQDRVLVRDDDGVERMISLPREEVILFPEKLD